MRASTAATRSSCCSTTAAGKCCRRSFPDARYNETVHWPFSKLADLWGGRGFRAHTPRQFRDALDAAFAEEKRFSLIEVGLQPGDISPILRGFVHAVKTRVHAK